MIIGAQLYSVRDVCQTPEDIRKTFKALKEMGYGSVQVSGFDYDPQATRDAADEFGLHIGLTHTDFKEIRENTDEIIKKHKILGADVVGIGGVWGDYVDKTGSYQNYKRLIREAAEAVKKLNDAGLSFAYHNHYMEYNRLWDEPTMLEAIYEQTNWKLTFDTGWAAYAGSDVVADIKKFADRLKYVHIKDFKEFAGETDKSWNTICPIYEGKVPMDDILKALEEVGTVVAYVEQDSAPATGDSLGEMKKSIDNLKAKGWVK